MALARTRRLGDLPTGHDGKGYLTINGEVYQAFAFSKLTANTETTVEEKRFLGELVAQHAPRGMKISGSLSYYHCTSAMMKAMEAWKDGDAAYPDITLQGWAQMPGYGRCEVLLTGVILNNVGLLGLDDGGENASAFDTDFTADDFQILSRFKE